MGVLSHLLFLCSHWWARVRSESLGRIERDRLPRLDLYWGMAMIRAMSGETDPITKIILVTTLVLIGAVGWEYARLAWRIWKERKRG